MKPDAILEMLHNIVDNERYDLVCLIVDREKGVAYVGSNRPPEDIDYLLLTLLEQRHKRDEQIATAPEQKETMQ